MSHPNSLKNLRQFEVGNKGGPGTVRLPPELRIARRENMAKLIEIIHEYVGMTKEDAKLKLNGGGCAQLEEMIQGQINKAKEGDSNSFKFIVEVMCGKIPESDENVSATDKMTPEQKLEAARLMVKILEQQAHGPKSV